MPGSLVVVAATSEDNRLMTNGMSEFARDGRNSNCALLVSLEKKDFGSDHPLAGVEFQRRIEAAAFAAGGGGYKAPVQRLEQFSEGAKHLLQVMYCQLICLEQPSLMWIPIYRTTSQLLCVKVLRRWDYGCPGLPIRMRY